MGDEGKAVGIAQAPAALLSTLDRHKNILANSALRAANGNHSPLAYSPVDAREPARQGRLILY